MNDKVALQTVGALNASEASKELEAYGLADMKRAILAAAGFTPDAMAGILQQSVGTLMAALEANKVSYTGSGEDVVRRENADHSLRVRAASELANLVANIGGLKTDPRDKAQGDGSITVVAPFMLPSTPQASVEAPTLGDVEQSQE